MVCTTQKSKIATVYCHNKQHNLLLVMRWPLAISFLLVCICNGSGSVPDPMFAASLYQVSVNETFLEGDIARPEPGFLNVSCSQANNSALMYTLMAGESIPFAIDLTTGELMVTDDLDYETKTQYNFTAICTVTNDLNLTDASTVIVRLLPVNEHRPSIQPNRMIFVIVNELTPLGPLPATLPGNKFNVTDADLPADTINYTLRSPVGGVERLAYNESLRGIVLTQAYEPNSNCMTERIEFRVTVCDIYPPDDQCPNIALLVLFTSTNDNDPMFSQSRYSTRVSESMPINSSLLTVACTDRDVCLGDFAGMEIVDGNLNSIFAIDINGNITNTQVLDYEEMPRHTLTVRCFDSGFQQREAFATVEIQLRDENDNTPRCSPSSRAGTLAVGSHELTRVLRLSCEDDDEGMNSLLTYTVEGDLPQVPDGRFILNQTTGELLFSGELRSDEDFDFSVTVSDSGLPPFSFTVRVTVSVMKGAQEGSMLPMLLIIVVCVVGGLLLISCILISCILLLCCFCLTRRRNKSKKVVFYDPNHVVSGHPEPFAPGSFEEEREIDLYITDQISTSSQQTPLSHDHVITNTTVVVEKDPLGLVEAVSQQLEKEEHQDRNQEHELQESCLNQDQVAINMVTQPQNAFVQDTHLQDTADDNTAVVTIDTSSL